MDVEGLVAAMQGPDRAIRIVTANKMPAVVDFDVASDPEVALATPLDVIARRARQIAADDHFAERVARPWPSATRPGRPLRWSSSASTRGLPYPRRPASGAPRSSGK